MTKWRNGLRSICGRCSWSFGSAPTPATHPSCRASRWPRCTRPRVWNGMRSSSSALPTAPCPSRTRWHTAPTARPSKRSAGCSTSGSQGRECIWRSAGRWRAIPAAGRVDGRRASSTASPRNSQADTPGKPRKPRGPTPRCRVCNGALTTPAAVMLRRCEGCPSDIDEQLLADLKDWRLRTSKDMSVPAYVVFTDNTLIAIAETLPDRRRRARRDSRHRRPQARAVRAGRAGAGQGPPILVKIDAKTAGQKIGCAIRLLALSLKIIPSGREEGCCNHDDYQCVYRRRRGRHVADPPCHPEPSLPRRIPAAAAITPRKPRTATAIVASVNRGTI